MNVDEKIHAKDFKEKPNIKSENTYLYYLIHCCLQFVFSIKTFCTKIYMGEKEVCE